MVFIVLRSTHALWYAKRINSRAHIIITTIMQVAFVSGSGDGELRLWDLAHRKTVSINEAFTSALTKCSKQCRCGLCTATREWYAAWSVHQTETPFFLVAKTKPSSTGNLAYLQKILLMNPRRLPHSRALPHSRTASL